MDYDFLMSCNVPNIKALDPHPAKSWGGHTRASVPALLAGLMPKCTVKGCTKHGYFRSGPMELASFHKEGALFLYIPNGWILELIDHYVNSIQRKRLMYWINHLKDQPTKQMVKALQMNLMGRREYLAYLHVMETHSPFFPSNPKSENRRKDALEEVDKMIEPLLFGYPEAQVIVTSDHGLKHNEWNEGAFDVFIATNR